MGEILSTIWAIIAALWSVVDWLVYLLLAFLSLMLVHSSWLFVRQTKYKKETEQTLFEIHVPREIEKGPKAMEQFFSGLHSFRNFPANLKETYIDGETVKQFSFELLGSGGSVRLFMRVPRLYSDAVRSLLYAQYNDLEINVCEDDYLNRFPRTYEQLDSLGYDMWGMEAFLANEGHFPIKTYEEFEEKADERIIDPMAFFNEVVSGLDPNDTIMVQFVVKPDDATWQAKGERALEKIRDKRLYYEDEAHLRRRYTPETEIEKQLAKQVQSKVSKDAFKTIIRYLYIGPKATFNEFFGYRNFFAFFNQLSTDANYFYKNIKTWTRSNWFEFPYIFPHKRLVARSKIFYRNYLTRYFPEATFIGKMFRSIIPWHFAFHQKTALLSTAELATLFHPPTNVIITTGLMDRVESKRVAPPSDLPR